MAKTKVENTKDGRFVTTDSVEPPTKDGFIDPDVKDPVREKFLKHNELLVKKREKEEVLRLAEVDVKRTYESAQQLFKNSTDYLRNTIVPVHGKHEVLGPYSAMLESWLAILDEWSDGIPLGKDADWETIFEKINDIKKQTTKLNKEQIKVKQNEVEKRKDELRDINKELEQFKD